MTALGKRLALPGRVARAARGVFVVPNVFRPGRPTLVVGHRGAADEPPSTVRACQRAIELGARGVEVDVCVTSDGIGVLWHDRDPAEWIAMARGAGLEGQHYVPKVPDSDRPEYRPIAQLSSAEFFANYGLLRSNGFALGADDRAPVVAPDRLSALCEWAAGQPRAELVILDLKIVPSELDRVTAFLDELESLCVRQPPLAGRTVLLMTTQAEVFARLQEEVPRRQQLACARLAADFELPGVVETAEAIGARHVSIGATLDRVWPAVRLDLFEALHARAAGKLETVGLWTINDEKRLRQVRRMRVDYVLTDDIVLAVRILEHPVPGWPRKPPLDGRHGRVQA